MAQHKTLSNLFVNESKPRATVGVVGIAVLITVVTLGRLILPYGDFRGEAFSRGWAIAALVILNLVVMGAVIAFLVFLLKPPNWFVYAIVVVLSFPVVIATPIAVSTITGTEVPGKPESVKLTDIYGPWESWLKSEIEKPIKQTKAREIAAVVNRYQAKGKAGKKELIDRLDADLSSAGVPEDELAKLKDDANTILAMTGTPFPQRLRQVVRKLYDAGHRGAVQALAS